MSNTVHVYISQSDKGELVLGAGIDGYNSYGQKGGINVIEHQLEGLCELYPIVSRLKIMRVWGGIVDIEFLVQMLQLRYGRRFPALRQRATLQAVEALQTCGVLPADDCQLLSQGYRFLRTLENRLRIDCDQPVEALESEGAQLPRLARRMGYGGQDAAPRLLADYHVQREAIRDCYTRWFARQKGPEV